MPKLSDDDSNQGSASDGSSKSSGSSSSSSNSSSSASGSDSEHDSSTSHRKMSSQSKKVAGGGVAVQKASRLSESDSSASDSESEPEVKRRRHSPVEVVRSRRPQPSRTAAKAAPPRKKPVADSGRSSGRSKPQRQRSKYAQSSDEDSDSDDESRRASTRRGGASVSYKEDSADETGSEDLVEVDWEAEAAVPQEPDNAETIEKILDSRMGKKGATGPTTTIYAVEENGDPNRDFDAAQRPSEAEQQFLIKWQGWSHIHNTWESEQTLRDQRV